MDNRPHRSYQGVTPAPGMDASQPDPFQTGGGPEWRGSRDTRELLAGALGAIDSDPDDEYVFDEP